LKLSDLNGLVAIDRLNYARDVLVAVKEMPKIKPSRPLLRLSQIAPQLKMLEEEKTTELGKPSSFFGKIKESITKRLWH
jgi:hypothetical protein